MDAAQESPNDPVLQLPGFNMEIWKRLTSKQDEKEKAGAKSAPALLFSK
jgi:hypothetical protein